MMLMQVGETEWSVVMLDAAGNARELRIDEATAKQVQSGALSPDQLAAMIAAQQQQGGAGGGGSSGDKAS